MRAGLPAQWEGVDIAFGTTHTLQMSPRMKCLDIVAHACDLSTQEAEGRGPHVRGQPKLHKATLTPALSCDQQLATAKEALLRPQTLLLSLLFFFFFNYFY